MDMPSKLIPTLLQCVEDGLVMQAAREKLAEALSEGGEAWRNDVAFDAVSIIRRYLTGGMTAEEAAELIQLISES